MNSRERRKLAAEKHNRERDDKKAKKVATIGHRSNRSALVMGLAAALSSSVMVRSE